MLTTDKFILKSKEIHGDKYDYSLVDYIKSKLKVKIVCKEHGIFEQTPNSHLRGNGCIKCYNDRRRYVKLLTTQEYINKSNEIHQNKYDYSLINYKGSHFKVKIICKKHGIFEQKSNDHLNGSGCPMCYGTKQKTLKQFIKESKEIHGDKYDYSLVKYINNSTKVKIICKEHGVFEQKPIHHINNKCGCPKCNDSKGEIEIRNILENNNIIFITQKTFNNCKNKRKLPFDFYLPEYNTCIEYDGEQHFKSIKIFGGKEELIKRQLRDKIKNQYCKTNKIQLLRIKYDENISRKIESYLQKTT